MNVYTTESYLSGVQGIFSAEELDVLRQKRVAVLGLGRSGGRIAVDLAPFVGELVLADPDIYQLKNIAVGQPCDTRTIGQNKAEVAAASVRAANPEIKLHVYSEGVTRQNVEAIVATSDLVMEAIDINEGGITRLVHESARRHRVPVMTGVHVAFGVNIFCYKPQGPMTWEEHLGFNAADEDAALDLLRFAIAPPPGIPRSVFDEVMSGARETVPTFLGAVALGSSLMLTHALLYLCNRRPLTAMPEYIHADLYSLQIEVRTFST